MSIPADSEGFVGCLEVLVEPLMSEGLAPGSARLDAVAFGETPNTAPTVEIDVLLQ